jgi:hypothetical protein
VLSRFFVVDVVLASEFGWFGAAGTHSLAITVYIIGRSSSIARGKRPVISNVAVAGEFAGWCWSLAVVDDMP